MTQAERTFQERGEAIAKKLEAMAKYVRDAMKQDSSAIERASRVVAEAQDGIGGSSLRTLIKRAVLADGERDNEKRPQT